MLPTSRILSVIVLGLGLALVAWGIAAPRVIDADARMPLDLEKTTFRLIDDSATTRLIHNGQIIQVPFTRQLHMTILPPSDNDTATVRVGYTDMRTSMQSENERLSTASVWSYSFDRVSGESTSAAVVADQLASPTQEVELSGGWLKFPVDTQQTSYDIFDVTARQSIPAVFSAAEQRDGRTVYRFVQEIEPINVARNYNSVANTIEVDVDGEAQTAYLYHSGTRELYVDQITGLIVDWHENIDDYYGDEQGKKLEQALLFQGSLAAEDAQALLVQASGVSDGHTFRLVNYIVLGFGIVLSIIGMAGAFLVGRRRLATEG
ncbi:putative secreted protein [Corynebacterium kutscheri]|nr:DUF3068 domain-containing protein [Corynebacterium kutscheri]AKE40520.1 Protein of unknown function (DUF3068) [Corynebacterium kutscheri]VEH10915.1 putative secreted protein [Corynebacterium kutscheri]VEH80609.1 putative secreted protein [Corynebacterium kutscheri]